jgi:hypothetical protein
MIILELKAEQCSCRLAGHAGLAGQQQGNAATPRSTATPPVPCSLLSLDSNAPQLLAIMI